MAKTEIVWSEAARQDLFALLAPMRASSPKRTARLTRKLIQATTRLSAFPESGRSYTEILSEENLREVVVEQARLFYLYDAQAALVTIMAVFSARQDVAAQLRSRLDMDENPKEE